MDMSADLAETPKSTVDAASSGRAPTGVATLTAEHVSGETWDRTVAAFDGVCQEQLYVFARNRWPGVACEPLLFRRHGEIIGGVLMMVQPLPLRLGSIAVSKWGPIFRHADSPDQQEIYAGTIEAILDEYDHKRGMMVSMLPRAHWGVGNPEFEHLERRGFKRGSVLLFPDRYVVNLRLGDEEQRKSFAQKWRYHLNKSMKAGLSFERAEAGRIGEFDALYQAMTDRKRFPDHSAYDDTIMALMQIDDDRLRPELFFVRQGEEIVAGAVIFKAGDTAVYLYGATNDKALPLRAGYFLHWHIIRWLRDNTQARWYDLGGTDGFQGLHQFKKGMVGDAGVIAPVPPVANYASHMRAYLAGHLAFGAREAQARLRRVLEGLRPGGAHPDQTR